MPNSTAMQQEVIHRLIRILAHAAPASQHKAPLFQIITSENPAPSRRPYEEGNPRRSLYPPNALPRKANLGWNMQHMIERTRIKTTPLIRVPH
jgi:hypothetical protein